MIQTNQPESAFPSTFRSLSGPDGEQQVHRWGMQLRDYFAAKAMQSLILDGFYQSQGAEMGWDEFGEELTDDAYAIADHMLKAREKNDRTR
jgi:hypothetical protein